MIVPLKTIFAINEVLFYYQSLLGCEWKRSV